MRCYNWILVTVLLFGFTAFSQQKTTEHIVSKGETISKIAQQYNVTIKNIYELNPEAKKGIKFNSILLIPSLLKNTTLLSTSALLDDLHEVLPKETLYGISKEYSISVEELYKLNPSLEETGLKIGQKIIISDTSKSGTSLVKKDTHKRDIAPIREVDTNEKDGVELEVVAKQSKYSIAKEYKITVAALENANPILKTTELKVGQIITIPVKKISLKVNATKKELLTNKEAEAELISAKKDIVSIPSVLEVESVNDSKVGIEYEVLSKQTKYNIAKEHGINVAMLDKANPILQTEELKEGQKIIIPVKRYIPNQAEQSTLNESSDVSRGNSKQEQLGSYSDDSSKEVISISYKVLAKETKYSIAKKHGITVKELNNANLLLDSEGLKIGQKIIIPVTNPVSSIQEKQDQNLSTTETALKSSIENKVEVVSIKHEVLPKETKYGIAKEFGITVKELEKQNPKIVSKFTIGSILTISKLKTVNLFTELKEDMDESVEEESFSKSINNESFVNQLISTASENIGTRYRIGGTTKDGFDCSGLMCTAFGTYDIQLPRTSLEQSQYGTVVEVEQAKKGDLIFFKTRGGSRINHVGMVVEVVDGDVKFIHASNSGVIISSIKENYYSKRVVQVNRVL